MTGKILIVPTYKSELGDALFPGTDIFNAQLSSLVSELVGYCSLNGYPIDSYGLSKGLGEFKPSHLTAAWTAASHGQDWAYQKQLQKWSDVDKPMIAAAIEKHFIDGGKEEIGSAISAFLDQLVDAGIKIDGLGVLQKALTGDWKGAFIKYALMGRPEGVVMHKKTAETSCLVAILRQNDFSDSQVDNFVGSLQ